MHADTKEPAGLPAIVNNVGPLAQALGASVPGLAEPLAILAVAVGLVTNWER